MVFLVLFLPRAHTAQMYKLLFRNAKNNNKNAAIALWIQELRAALAKSSYQILLSRILFHARCVCAFLRFVIWLVRARVVLGVGAVFSESTSQSHRKSRESASAHIESLSELKNNQQITWIGAIA